MRTQKESKTLKQETDTESGKSALPLPHLHDHLMCWSIDLIQPLKYIGDEAKTSVFREVLINWWLPKSIICALAG